MKNPKIRIESNGRQTELYVDGLLIDKAVMADFHFHAEPFTATLEYEKYVLDENGNYIVQDNDCVTEKGHIRFD